MLWLRETISRLEQGAAVVHVTVLRTEGSAPRPTGTKMLVAGDAVVGTIGGGALERRASERARLLLADGSGGERRIETDFGQTELLFERLRPGDLPPLREIRDLLDAEGAILLTPLDRSAATKQAVAWAAAPTEIKAVLAGGAAAAVVSSPGAGLMLVERLVDRRTRVWLFGAGHVGRALVKALAPLPFHITWIDDRPGFLPLAGDGLVPLRVDAPALQVANAPAGALIVAMSHSHALDFDIVQAALARDDLGFVGMIASTKKKAQLVERCRRAGISEARIRRLTAPIGMAGIGGRDPSVIAASVAAQLLQVSEALAGPAAEGGEAAWYPLSGLDAS